MSETQPKTGFPDLPIDPRRSDGVDNSDLLGLEHHAAALAGFIDMCSTPMTIGVQGDWGSGKTSLMNLMRAKLGDGRALNIWFNTWQYAQFGNEDQLASSMLVNLMQKVKAEGQPSKKVWHNASRFIRGVVQASAIKGAGLSVQGSSLLDAFEGRGSLDDAGLFEQMKEDFAEVINDVLAGGDKGSTIERVVIYIDDLDRLAPSKAVELLEAIKNLIDVEGCVFVLAIDYDVVIRGLRQRKGYNAEEFRESEGKNFFDKIIQVPYRMPVERYTTQKFLQSHFERVYGALSPHAAGFFDESATELIQLSVGNNPRSLKRALNIHSLFSHLMRIGRGEEEVGDGERIISLVFACIQVALPQMYSLLAKQASPFRTLVSLCEPEVYEMLTGDDESESFRELAVRLGEAIHAVEEDDDDDDEEDTEQAVAELRVLLGDLRRFVTADDTARHKRIQKLATIALQAIDVNHDGLYSQTELEALDTALSVTSSTSVDTDGPEETEEPPRARVRQHVGFKELAETLPALMDRPRLIFWDPVAKEYDENFKRLPDYESGTSRLHVIVDGVSESLKDETLRVLHLRHDRGGRELTKGERSGRVNTKGYWVAEGDEAERTVVVLRDEWKTSLSREVLTRTESDRAAHDLRVLTYLRGRPTEPVPAREIQQEVGGTIVQMRRALGRLIEQGKVKSQGRARGTRYTIV